MEKEQLQEKGTLTIHSENIFPIIKKWLYSDRDIFIRELVSNAVDAIVKLKRISLSESYENDQGEFAILVKIDEGGAILSFEDNGIGMTAEEMKKYINQIAFSGAEDFLKKYRNGNEQNQIIGHFGLGFYSAFMVAKTVEIETKSYLNDEPPVFWSCDGSNTYEMKGSQRTARGTEVRVFLNEDSLEFLSKETVRSVLMKYCGFLPVPVRLNGEQINETEPLWTKMPQNCKEEDYKEFYKKVFGRIDEPLFSIHLNVDYPFNLKGVLFFPKIKHQLDPTQGQIKLFCNQVFVSDNCKELIPEFLLLLQGVIDSPDIPLNVSRSALQREPIVAKIATHIIKKISDRLNELFNEDRPVYERYWEDINPFIKYGMMKEDRFYEKVKDIVVFTSSNGGTVTLDEYLKRNEAKHKNKVYYANDLRSQVKYLDLFKRQDLEAIVVDQLIDPHFIQFLEYKNSLVQFSRVDSDISDNLVEKEAESKIIDPKDDKNLQDKVKDLFKKCLNLPKLQVEIKKLKSGDVPAMIVVPEYARRLREMSRLMNKDDDGLPDDHTLILNSHNPIVKNLQRLAPNADVDSKVSIICRHLYDLALLSQRNLDKERMTDFIRRSESLLEQYSQKSLIIT